MPNPIINLQDVLCYPDAAYIVAQLLLAISGKVNAESGKRLMTDAEGTKLAGIAAGAQANVIEGLTRNGVALTPSGKTINIVVPVNLSDLVNDTGFITNADIPEGAAASTTAPLMDGTAAAGSSNAFARGDHVHPSDSSKVDVSTYNTKMGNIDGALVNLQSDVFDITSDLMDVYTKSEVDAKVASIWHIKPGVATEADLPSSGNTENDVRHVTANGGEYYWTGSAWEPLGFVVDLSGYLQTSDISITRVTQAQLEALFTSNNG